MMWSLVFSVLLFSVLGLLFYYNALEAECVYRRKTALAYAVCCVVLVMGRLLLNVPIIYVPWRSSTI